jgi:atypical dual specificity phosphatase
MAADNPDQDLSQFFSVCNDFIHGARLRKDCNVLIHCLAGMSRSVTICIAYIMSVSQLNWRDALRVVRVGRKIANPNAGFQIQLQDFENNKLLEERRRMKERFPSLAVCDTDQEYMYRALEHFDTMIASRDLCHFNCKRNENCPTGMFEFLISLFLCFVRIQSCRLFCVPFYVQCMSCFEQNNKSSPCELPF